MNLLWLTLLPTGYATLMTAINHLTWRRGVPVLASPPTVSALIPARNEAGTIQDCITAIAGSTVPVASMVVCDDASTDATPTILTELAAHHNNLHVIQGKPLPMGWVGKVYACHQLSQHAVGEVLVFIDADTQVYPDGLQQVLSLLGTHRADVVSCVPRQRTHTLAERLLMPWLFTTYLAWFPLVWVYASSWPIFCAANGQVLAITRSAYQTLGGHAAIASSLVDDMALCRRAKQLGLKVVFADGHHIATCRMYDGFGSIWQGFTKNIAAGLGSLWAVLCACGLYLLAFSWPLVALLVGLWWGQPWFAIGLVGCALQAGLWFSIAYRHRLSGWAGLAAPITALVVVAMALNSWFTAASGRIRWAGRRYSPTGGKL